MGGKRYTKEEWAACENLRKCGKTWAEISTFLGRGENNNRLQRMMKKYPSHEEYLADLDDKKRKKYGKRKTEQLQFIPPEAPKPPKKIQVKKAYSEEDMVAYKLGLARRQAIAINNFVKELRDAGFRV